MINKFSNIILNKTDSILDALKKMDSGNVKLLILLSNSKFYSVLSIGDIQRAIIGGVQLNKPVESIVRSRIKVFTEDINRNEIIAYIKKNRNEFMPIVSRDNKLIDVIFLKDVILDKKEIVYPKLNIPVVIMAGGQGTRLKPLTNVLPKPLIPIGSKSIMENIMDRFVTYGCDNFFVSVNYKSEILKYYFSSLNESQYFIKYFQEERPLGTAGSLHLIKDKIKTTFFVSNCDCIVNQDLDELLKYHRDNNNEITLVAALKTYSIPYGTIDTIENGILSSIEEKPELTFNINTGLYILEPHLLDEIPVNEFYHITSLIQKLCDEKRRVGVFPVSEKSWIDIGNWEEYLRTFKVSE